MAEDFTRPVCLGLLCGIPASGKSTIACQLQNHVAQVLPGQLAVLLLQYDTLIPEPLERQLIVQSAEQGCSLWKPTRSQVKACVNQLLHRLVEGELSTSELFSNCTILCHHSEEPQEDNSGQAINLLQLSKPAEIDASLWETFVTCVDSSVKKAKVGVTVSADTLPISWLVLIDDNMHYRSMRYEYCQLARKYSTGFCLVYVSCPLDEAMRRNRSRSEGRVEDHVIINMYGRLEVPDHRTHSWENHSMTVDGTATVEMQPLVELVQRAMMDPLKPSPEEDEELKVLSRYICSTSVIHQADQILRKCVSHQMTVAKGLGSSKEHLKALSTRLATQRSEILDGMKKGDITLPFQPDENSVLEASKNASSPLYVFVSRLFADSIAQDS